MICCIYIDIYIYYCWTPHASSLYCNRMKPFLVFGTKYGNLILVNNHKLLFFKQPIHDICGEAYGDIPFTVSRWIEG